MQIKEALEVIKISVQAPTIRRLLIVLVLVYAVAGFWMINCQDQGIQRGKEDHLQRVEAAKKEQKNND